MDEIYKIVRILSDTEIVINGGHEHGLREGDILEIFVEGEEIKDPETSESLGTLDIIKGKVKIKTIYEKMSLCESAEFKTEKKYPAHMSALSQVAKSFENYIATEVKVSQPLNVDMTQAQQVTKVDKLIKLGDTIRPSL